MANPYEITQLEADDICARMDAFMQYEADQFRQGQASFDLSRKQLLIQLAWAREEYNLLEQSLYFSIRQRTRESIQASMAVKLEHIVILMKGANRKEHLNDKSDKNILVSIYAVAGKDRVMSSSALKERQAKQQAVELLSSESVENCFQNVMSPYNKPLPWWKKITNYFFPPIFNEANPTKETKSAYNASLKAEFPSVIRTFDLDQLKTDLQALLLASSEEEQCFYEKQLITSLAICYFYYAGEYERDAIKNKQNPSDSILFGQYLKNKLSDIVTPEQVGRLQVLQRTWVERGNNQPAIREAMFVQEQMCHLNSETVIPSQAQLAGELVRDFKQWAALGANSVSRYSEEYRLRESLINYYRFCEKPPEMIKGKMDASEREKWLVQQLETVFAELPQWNLSDEVIKEFKALSSKWREEMKEDHVILQDYVAASEIMSAPLQVVLETQIPLTTEINYQVAILENNLRELMESLLPLDKKVSALKKERDGDEKVPEFTQEEQSIIQQLKLKNAEWNLEVVNKLYNQERGKQGAVKSITEQVQKTINLLRGRRSIEGIKKDFENSLFFLKDKLSKVIDDLEPECKASCEKALAEVIPVLSTIQGIMPDSEESRRVSRYSSTAELPRRADTPNHRTEKAQTGVTQGESVMKKGWLDGDYLKRLFCKFPGQKYEPVSKSEKVRENETTRHL